MTPVTRVDMFGTSPGRGSLLDVLLPDPARRWPEKAAAAHAHRTDADETALVSGCWPEEQSFSSRVFNALGETPFAMHSLAGVAASLVVGGHLEPGVVVRTSPAGDQRLWTDGRAVRVPFDGHAIHDEAVADASLALPRGCRAHRVGVGRGFTLVRVEEDPLTLPAPAVARMLALGVTDLTLYRWDPEHRQVLARVLAPGFGIPEDAGCLPVAAALALAAMTLDPVPPGSPTTVVQLTSRDTRSSFTCVGTLRGGAASLQVAGPVWVGDEAARRVS